MILFRGLERDPHGSAGTFQGCNCGVVGRKDADVLHLNEDGNDNSNVNADGNSHNKGNNNNNGKNADDKMRIMIMVIMITNKTIVVTLSINNNNDRFQQSSKTVPKQFQTCVELFWN